MKKALFIAILFSSCNLHPDVDVLKPLGNIEIRDYLEINNEVQEILQKHNGKFPMLVYEKIKGNKHLVYLGEQHGNASDESGNNGAGSPI